MEDKNRYKENEAEIKRLKMALADATYGQGLPGGSYPVGGQRIQNRFKKKFRRPTTEKLKAEYKVVNLCRLLW